jgi:gamma-glutamyltranspeptidase / glutathione hydrolase
MRRVLVSLAVALTALTAASLGTARAAPTLPPKTPTALGTGGAAASVDPLATQTAIDVLRNGGNAIDAAVAAAATLGVVEPFSCGIGGGGFMLIYLAKSHRVVALDSRETAPASATPTMFIDPATGQPLAFADAVESGLSVGVPGTLASWDLALRRYGTTSLADALAPGIQLARRGFVVDQTFHDQIVSNQARFAAITPSAELYLPGGAPPEVGSVFQNPDLAKTYALLSRRGIDPFYTGKVGEAIVQTVQHPPVAPDSTLNVRPGGMTIDDLADYQVRIRRPTAIDYRGYQIYGMSPPSSGGSTIGEILNILSGFDLAGESRADALYQYLEASRLAYADRGAYLGDPEFFDVPLRGLLSPAFAAERAALIPPTAPAGAVPAGNPYPFNDDPSPEFPPGISATIEHEGPSTTHLTVADRQGNVVTYTFTIEQIGGSAMVVPGYGFLLNNELTDFNFVPPGANAVEPFKRPRSSMSPTIVMKDGKVVEALGSPGGSTIVTTVTQLLIDQLDFGMTLPQAMAAPRISQRNSATTQAEPAFLATPEAAALTARGEQFVLPPAPPEIGAASAIAFVGKNGKLMQAAAEPVRRGGGSALVVNPR